MTHVYAEHRAARPCRPTPRRSRRSHIEGEHEGRERGARPAAAAACGRDAALRRRSLLDRRGRRRTHRRHRPSPCSTMLRPSALTPPSAKRRHCTVSDDRHAQRADPRADEHRRQDACRGRWPLVPPATGKLSICTGTRMRRSGRRSGICLSSIVSEAFRGRPRDRRPPPRHLPSDVASVDESIGDVHLPTDLKVVASHLQ